MKVDSTTKVRPYYFATSLSLNTFTWKYLRAVLKTEWECCVHDPSQMFNKTGYCCYSYEGCIIIVIESYDRIIMKAQRQEHCLLKCLDIILSLGNKA